jgi:hypothetical protein
MGFFDTVKEKANAVAADAERAGKVTAAQARLLVLQSDLRKAERDLGRGAAALIEAGAMQHPDLEPAAARVREIHEAVRAKEAEIAALRASGASGRASTPPVKTAPAATDEAAPAAAEEPPAKPAAPRHAAAEKRPAKKAPGKKPAAKKAPAKKPAGGAKPAGKKPAAQKPAAAKPPASTE